MVITSSPPPAPFPPSPPCTRTSAPSITLHPGGIFSILYPRQPSVVFPSKRNLHPVFFSSSVSVLFSAAFTIPLTSNNNPAATPPIRDCIVILSNLPYRPRPIFLPLAACCPFSAEASNNGPFLLNTAGSQPELSPKD